MECRTSEWAERGGEDQGTSGCSWSITFETLNSFFEQSHAISLLLSERGPHVMAERQHDVCHRVGRSSELPAMALRDCWTVANAAVAHRLPYDLVGPWSQTGHHRMDS